MEGAVRIPYPVVHIEVVPVRFMDSMIVSTEIPAILSNFGHAAERAVESRIEDRPLPLCPTLDFHFVQGLLPDFPRSGFHLHKSPRWYLMLQVAARLIHADVRESDTNLKLLSACDSEIRDESNLFTSLPT